MYKRDLDVPKTGNRKGMRFKLSRCVCINTPDVAKAVAHFQTALGMKVLRQDEASAELAGDEAHLFVDLGPEKGPIMELLVPNLEGARDELLADGWTIDVWEGKGGRCHMRNPGGFVFNLWEEPTLPAAEEADPEARSLG
jgi:catechol 2,3-dioxygenase-like lactoylglutathione lyase family enzyme